MPPAPLCAANARQVLRVESTSSGQLLQPVSHFAALRYHNSQLRLAICSHRHVLNLSHREEAVDDFAEDDVLVIEPIALIAGDEELASIRVRPTVGHRQEARLVMLSVEVLIVELRPVD